MTIAQSQPLAALAREAIETQPTAHRWTFDEYMQISNAGLLDQKRTELLDGEIVNMNAQNSPHVVSISKVARLLMTAFDEEHFFLKIQSTSRLDDYNAPEPDFAVLPGPPADPGANPDHPLLAVEISDSTLLFDQSVKGSLYASKQIAEYWIVNVKERQLEIYREPTEDSKRRFGWRYASITIYRPPAIASPLSRPDVKIEVARMLP